MNVPFFVGIAGRSGSGKTTLAHTLADRHGSGQSVVIPFDAYYRDFTHLSPDERALVNWDEPKSLDGDLLAQHLLQLGHGRSVDVPTYDFANHCRSGSEVMYARPLVVVEGILLLAFPQIRRRLNFLVFVDTPEEVCLKRRVERDTQERGRSEASVHAQWQTTVEPMYREYVRPSAKYAHLRVRGDINLNATSYRILAAVEAQRSS